MRGGGVKKRLGLKRPEKGSILWEGGCIGGFMVSLKKCVLLL